MAVEFKSSMSKNELLEIAAEHGIEADDSMKKNDILKLLEQARAAEGAQSRKTAQKRPGVVTTRRRATKQHRSRRTAQKLPGG